MVTVAFGPCVAAEPLRKDANGNLTIILDDGIVLDSVPSTILEGVPEESWAHAITKYIMEHPGLVIGGGVVVTVVIVRGIIYLTRHPARVPPPEADERETQYVYNTELWESIVYSNGLAFTWDIESNSIMEVIQTNPSEQAPYESLDQRFTTIGEGKTSVELTDYLASKGLRPLIRASQPWTRPAEYVTCTLCNMGKRMGEVGIMCIVNEPVTRVDGPTKITGEANEINAAIHHIELPTTHRKKMHIVYYTDKNDRSDLSQFLIDKLNIPNSELTRLMETRGEMIPLDMPWENSFSRDNSGNLDSPKAGGLDDKVNPSIEVVSDQFVKEGKQPGYSKTKIPVYTVPDLTNKKLAETGVLVSVGVSNVACGWVAAETGAKVGGTLIATGGPVGWVLGGVIVAASGAAIAWIWMKPENMPEGPGGMVVASASGPGGLGGLGIWSDNGPIDNRSLLQLEQEDLKQIVDKVQTGNFEEVAWDRTNVSYIVDSSGSGEYQIIGVGKVAAGSHELSHEFWKIDAIDTIGGYEGTSPGTSLVLDKAGRPHVTYYNAKMGSIMHAWQAGDNWTTEIVAPSAGTYSTSLAFGPDNNPVISYGDGVHFGNLMVAQKKGSKWNIAIVARGTVGDAGEYSSLAFDPQGILHIAYNDGKHLATLYYATMNPTSGDWEFSQVDDGGVGGDTGYNPSLKIDAMGNPHISYRNGQYWPSLMYATSADGGKTWTKTKVDNGGKMTGQSGWGQSLALDNHGFPHIVYYNQTGTALQYASSGYDGATWDTEIIYSGYFAAYSSTVIDDRGIPHISFYDMTNHRLCYATLSPDKTKWMIHVVDDDGEAGAASSLALSQARNPSIAYYDNTIHQLLFAQWVP